MLLTERHSEGDSEERAPGGEDEMTGKPRKTSIRLKLTECQQAQIRQVTGREVTSIELRLHSLPEPPEPARGEEETR